MKTRRRLIKIGLFLLVGAILNVAVAWAYWIPTYLGLEKLSGRRLTDSEAQALWATYAPNNWPKVTHFSGESYSGTMKGLEMIDAAPSPLANGSSQTNFGIARMREGWPCYATENVHAVVDEPLDSKGWRTVSDVSSTAIEFKFGKQPSSQLAVSLAYSPLWPGFAINTVFYAAILWLLCVGPGFVRRRLRIWRGKCPACGYDLRGQVAGDSGESRCPECGLNV